MERTPENIREFREKVIKCLDRVVDGLKEIENLCTDDGYDDGNGEYMSWFNDYLLPEYDGKPDAYPFNHDFLEQISLIEEWIYSLEEANKK